MNSLFPFLSLSLELSFSYCTNWPPCYEGNAIGYPPKKKKQEKNKERKWTILSYRIGGGGGGEIAGDFIALHRLIERAVLVAWRQLDVMKL